MSVCPKSPLSDVIPAKAGIQLPKSARKSGFRIESGMTNYKNGSFRTDTSYFSVSPYLLVRALVYYRGTRRFGCGADSGCGSSSGSGGGPRNGKVMLSIMFVQYHRMEVTQTPKSGFTRSASPTFIFIPLSRKVIPSPGSTRLQGMLSIVPSFI